MELRVFYNDTLNRKAELIKKDNAYICKLFTKSVLWDTRTISNRNEWYCEDLCENFVDGIGEFRVLNKG